MKKHILILLFILMTLTAAAQNKLYDRYATRKDLTVAHVDGFRLNDSTKVDVVMLVADDATSWQKLMKELNVSNMQDVTSWLADVNNPARRVRWTGAPVIRVVVSPTRRTVGFYRLNNEAQYDALVDYQLNNMKGKKK